MPETTWAGAVADEAGRQRSHGFTLLAAFGAASVFALLLFGSEVMAKKAWGIYPDWPLMGGTLFPPYTDLTSTQILHRWVAIAVGFIGVGIAVVAWRTQRHRPVVLRVTMLAAVLYPLQAVAGAAQILTGLAPWTQVVHLGLGATIWTLMATVTVLSYYTTRAAAGAPGPLLAAAGAGRRVDALASARAYLALTKPRIIFLLLVTTVPAMVLAARQVPGMEPGRWAWLVTWTLLSGSLAAGGANAINSYLDRDIDAIMARTRRRPLPAQTVAPERAVAFGLVLGAGALGLMAAMVNLVAAFLTLLAIGCYVVVYTILLKRTSTQNIVIGGVAGALPPLIGWAAVTGSLALVPIVMFGIVFYWTPPHFWALSLRHRADYEAARIPMLPVVRGVVQTARQVGLYSILLVAVSLLLVSVARLGAVYLGAAAILGVIFLALALRLWLAAGAEPAATDRATRLYQFSMAYLGLLFAAMVLDTLVALPLA